MWTVLAIVLLWSSVTTARWAFNVWLSEPNPFLNETKVNEIVILVFSAGSCATLVGFIKVMQLAW